VHRYKAFNAAMVTTVSPVKVATVAATLKTMMQVATPATRQLQVISWGFSIDAAPGASTIELVQTDVAATMTTAHAAAGVQPLDPNAPASLVTLGTTATGFNASAEGTTAASRSFSSVLLASAQVYEYQFMPDERPIVAVSKFLRVRVITTSAVSMLTWITWDE
jgi:hypothetical protein